MLATFLAILVQKVGGSNSPDFDQQSFSATLWYAAADARGSWLCDQRVAKQQRKRFDKIYGERVERLTQGYFAGHPPEPPFDIILTCQRARSPLAGQAYLRRELTDFEPRLQALERAYGVK